MLDRHFDHQQTAPILLSVNNSNITPIMASQENTHNHSTHHQFSSAFWAIERAEIQRLLHSKGDIAMYMPGSGNVIQINHAHYYRALDKLKNFILPRTMEEFVECYKWIEWDIVGERLLLAVRLCILEPNEFQNFLLGIYMWEYAPEVCPYCGLNSGVWCDEGKYSLTTYLLGQSNNIK